MKENTMKVKCPKCNTMGFLEKRGNSYRIKHYKGYVNYSRKYIIHSLSQEDAFRMGINHASEAKSLDQASRQLHIHSNAP